MWLITADKKELERYRSIDLCYKCKCMYDMCMHVYIKSRPEMQEMNDDYIFNDMNQYSWTRLMLNNYVCETNKDLNLSETGLMRIEQYFCSLYISILLWADFKGKAQPSVQGQITSDQNICRKQVKVIDLKTDVWSTF